jgi:competence protein ComEA
MNMDARNTYQPRRQFQQLPRHHTPKYPVGQSITNTSLHAAHTTRMEKIDMLEIPDPDSVTRFSPPSNQKTPANTKMTPSIQTEQHNNAEIPDVAKPSLSLKQTALRWLVFALALVFLGGLYLIWKPTTNASNNTQSTIATPAPTSIVENPPATTQAQTQDTPTNTTSKIQIYIVGAIHHPGVYTLPANTRIYQLLQAAGGPLSDADLVTINLAAHLTDGQEIYVPRVGETSSSLNSSSPASTTSTPTTTTNTTGTLVNINTASADELRQNLDISSTTAQNIVNYRQQHGSYTSVADLLQVVSASIYTKIKDQVSVS